MDFRARRNIPTFSLLLAILSESDQNLAMSLLPSVARVKTISFCNMIFSIRLFEDQHHITVQGRTTYEFPSKLFLTQPCLDFIQRLSGNWLTKANVQVSISVGKNGYYILVLIVMIVKHFRALLLTIFFYRNRWNPKHDYIYFCENKT